MLLIIVAITTVFVVPLLPLAGWLRTWRRRREAARRL